jgi:hypothetical protein
MDLNIGSEQEEVLRMVCELLCGQSNKLFEFSTSTGVFTYRYHHHISSIPAYQGAVTNPARRPEAIELMHGKSLSKLMYFFMSLANDLHTCRHFVYEYGNLESAESKRSSSEEAHELSKHLSSSTSMRRQCLDIPYATILAIVSDFELAILPIESWLAQRSIGKAVQEASTLRNISNIFQSKDAQSESKLPNSLLSLYIHCRPWVYVFQMMKQLIVSLEECLSQGSNSSLVEVIESRMLEIMAESRRLSHQVYSLGKSGRSAVIHKPQMTISNGRKSGSADEEQYSFSRFRSAADVLKIFRNVTIRWDVSSLFRIESSVPPFQSLNQQHQQMILQHTANKENHSRLAVGNVYRHHHHQQQQLSSEHAKCYRGFSMSNTKISSSSLAMAQRLAASHPSESATTASRRHLHLKSVMLIDNDGDRVAPSTSSGLLSKRIEHQDSTVALQQQQQQQQHDQMMLLYSLPENLRFRLMIGLPLMRMSDERSQREVDKLFQVYRLDAHFSILRAIYLFGDMDAWQAMQDFYLDTWLSIIQTSDAEEQGSIHYPRQQLQMLAQSLSTHFRSSSSTSCKAMVKSSPRSESKEWSLLVSIVDLNSSSSSSSSPLSERLAALLSMEVIYRPPISNIIPSKAFASYAEIFRSLFQLQLAKWLSDACWKDGLSARGCKMLNLRDIQALALSSASMEGQEASAAVAADGPRRAKALFTCKSTLPSIFHFTRSIYSLVFDYITHAWESFHASDIASSSSMTSIAEVKRMHAIYLEAMREPIALIMEEIKDSLSISFEALEAFHRSIELYGQLLSDNSSNSGSDDRDELFAAIHATEQAAVSFVKSKESLRLQLITSLKRNRSSSAVAKEQRVREVKLKLLNIIS